MAAKEFFDGKSVLLTGGSGSFGGALVSELLRTHKPRVLRVLDHDENALWTLESKFAADRRLRLLLGDIREPDRLLLALQDIDIVIHAAALKHVPSGEYNPFEAVKTNVLGTQNVIDAALAAGVGTVVLTSTDKAANPSNVMGTTKLLAEKLTVAANYYRGRRRTRFSCVRFGNVLGSRGSAPLLFRDQIAMGGPVTLTDPRMTRFLMSLDDAVRLVLKAVTMTQGGETFILKMKTARVKDIVAVMLRNLSQGRRIEIRRTGRKPGEKIYEELLTEEEVARAHELPEMYLLLPTMPELLPGDLHAYPGARPARPISYRSDRVRPIPQREIELLLRASGLL